MIFPFLRVWCSEKHHSAAITISPGLISDDDGTPEMEFLVSGKVTLSTVAEIE